MNRESENFADQSMHGKRKVAVTHHFETEIDVDRLEQWLNANFPEGRVKVTDIETGSDLHDGF